MSLVVVTPSFRRDLELCRELNVSVMRAFLPPVRHVILVDRLDLPAFREMAGNRTDVVLRRTLLPRRAFLRLPFGNSWLARGCGVRVGGWLMQQIVKLAYAAASDEDTVLLVDSDVTFIHAVPEGLYDQSGPVRLFRRDNAFTGASGEHVVWHDTAARLLGLSAMPPPLPNYISNVVAWSPPVVRAMLRRIEEVAGRAWWEVVALTSDVSEYVLYGTYCDRLLAAQPEPGLVHDPLNHCYAWWETQPLGGEAVERFMAACPAHAVAVAIQATSCTPGYVRQHIREALTSW